MSAEPVPASTPIHTRSVPHVGTDRLLRRLEFLREHLRQSYLWAEQKGEYGARVREAMNVERELIVRNEPFQPVTDGQHVLTISPHECRVIRPPQPRAKEQQ